MDKLQIPPIRTDLNESDSSQRLKTGKQWYEFWRRSGERINSHTDELAGIVEDIEEIKDAIEAIPPDVIDQPGQPTVGVISYRWLPNTELGSGESCAFELMIPVTPPSPVGVYAGVHLWLEVPDGSAAIDFTFRAGGGKLGEDRTASVWLPRDFGKHPYDLQPSQIVRARIANVAITTNSTMDVRVMIVAFSPSYDPPPIRNGLPGATPSWVVNILPLDIDKPDSAVNITPYTVTSLTATAGTPQIVNNRMQTPISVTVDLSTVPNPRPPAWGYRLIAYINGVLTSAPIFFSDVLQRSGLILFSGNMDGITSPHTFGLITPAAQTNVVIYAVAGIVAPDLATFQLNNIIVGITASATVVVGAVVLTVSIAEIGARYQNPPGGSTYTTIRVTAGSQEGATTATIWFTFNDGASYTWIGVYPFTNATHQDLVTIVPLGTSTFRAKLAPGSYTSSASPPSNAVASNPLTLAIGPPTAPLATLSITNQWGDAPTKDNIFMGRGINGPYARVVFKIQTAGALDPAAFWYQWWVMWVDSAGNPINPGNVLNTSGWQDHYGSGNDGKLQEHHLDINYPAVANAYLEIRVYARSRNSDGTKPPFTGDSSAVVVPWPGGLTYYRLLVGLPPGADQVTNPGNDQNSNPTISMLANWSFLYNVPGFWVQSGARAGTGYLSGWNAGWNAGASIECRNDGGSSGSSYTRLTGFSTSITQTVSVIAGAKIYLSVALRSSNHSTNHNLNLYVDWLNSSSGFISTTTVGMASAYLSAWSPKAITGYVTVPANAAFGILRIATGASEPGYWDVDDVVMQPVLSQVTNDGTAEVSTGADGSNTGVFRAQGIVYSGVYGQDFAQLVGGSGGQVLRLANNGLSVRMTHGGSGVGQIAIGHADSYHAFVIDFSDSTGIRLAQFIAGATFIGHNGTVTTAAGSKPVRNGLICD